MATYVPDADDTSQPTGSQKVKSAAPEFRTMKEKLQRALVVPEEGPFPELPSAAERALSYLAFDSYGDPIVTIPSPDSATAVALALANLISGLSNKLNINLGAQLVALYSNGVDQADTVQERLLDLGPSSVVMTGVGAPVFTGGGLNNVAFGGTYNGSFPLQLIVKINTAAVPDTLAISCDNGATFVTTIDTYDPMTDSYITGPIPIVAGAMPIFATGATMTFATTTGHTAGNQWALTLSPNAGTVNNTGTAFKLSGVPFAHQFGTNNIGLGLGTFGDNTSVGVENTAVGGNVLKANKQGYANSGFGANVLRYNTEGFFNQGFGASCLGANTSGRNNSGYGTYCLASNTTGRDNSAYGVDSQVYCLSGYENTSSGVQSLYLNRIGFQNVASGLYCLRGGPWSTAAMSGLTDAQLSPQYATATGAFAGYNTRQSEGNSYYGFECGYNVTTGSNNTLMGRGAGFRLTIGSGNSHAGYNAGSNILQKVDATNTTLFGIDSYCTGDNAVAIGANAVAGANEVVLGNSSHLRIRASTDNNTNLGQGSVRFAVVFAGTGAINTSDERHKDQIEPIPDSWLDAWADVQYRRFKFKDSVVDKGDGARWHIGAIAQQVWEIFHARGIDAFAIGLCCYDKWEEEWIDVPAQFRVSSIMDSKSNPISIEISPPTRVKVKEAGDIWGLRYEEVFILEAAYNRRELQRLKNSFQQGDTQ